MDKKKKITLQDLQKAQSPEDIQRMLAESQSGEISQHIPEVKTELDMTQPFLVPPGKKSSNVTISKFGDGPDEYEPDVNFNGQKFVYKAGKVAINYETAGRFTIPDVAYFPDYSIQDINDIALSRQEDMFENIVIILNKLATNTLNGSSVEEMLLEEFYETLVGLKIQFNPGMHSHRWMCECQKDVPDDQKKFSEAEIDLSTLKYVSIEECDETIRAHFKKMFEDTNNFQKYLQNKYGEILETSVEEELENIKVTDNITVKDDQNVYVFRFTRVKDLLVGMKYAQKQYNWKIRSLKNKSLTGFNQEKELMDRRDAIEKLENEKAKYTILTTRALSLVAVNGQEISSDEEKIEAFSKIKRSTLMKLASMNDRIKFGIQDERDFTCRLTDNEGNVCGRTVRRVLQREISPIELLPIDDNDRTPTTRKLGLDPGLDIYFGV